MTDASYEEILDAAKILYGPHSVATDGTDIVVVKRRYDDQIQVIMLTRDKEPHRFIIVDSEKVKDDITAFFKSEWGLDAELFHGVD